MKRALITQAHLKLYGGSEIVTLEVAEWLKANGWDVSVLCPHIGPPMSAHFAPFHLVSDLEKPLGEFHLVWIHHHIIPNAVSVSPKAVFNHMSSFVDMEAGDKGEEGHIVLANSEETRATLPVDAWVFPNPAPDAFFQERDDTAQELLVVTNHMPLEVAIAVTELSRRMPVSVIGEGTSEYARLTPERLRRARAVITIGKTVQYCIASSIPVYVYDRFGGPGWLTLENFEQAAWYNFSGRCTGTKKPASLIASEIEGGITHARNEMARIKEQHGDKYRLDAHMHSILALLEGAEK